MFLFIKILTNPSGLVVGFLGGFLCWFFFNFSLVRAVHSVTWAQSSLSLVMGHQGGWALVRHPGWAAARQDHCCQEVMLHFILTPLHSHHIDTLIPTLQHQCFLELSLSWTRSWNEREMNIRNKGHILIDQIAGSAPQSTRKTMLERGWESWLAAAARGGGRGEKRNEMASVSST